ncbi:Protein tpx2 [Dinochytrium kinnereticum]|nr:Protein tpx2 [Dinochytrium kinnereticum]
MMNASLQYDVVPITDDYGPTKDDPSIQAIVGSRETEKGCYAVNDVRTKHSLNPLEIFLVDLVSPSGKEGDMSAKLSSNRAFEFNAPRFHDFGASVVNDIDPLDDNTDEWFDARIGSPAGDVGQKLCFLSAEKPLIKDDKRKSNARLSKPARLAEATRGVAEDERLGTLSGLFSNLDIGGTTSTLVGGIDGKNAKPKKLEIRPLTIPKEFNFASRAKMRCTKSPGVKKRKAPLKKANELTIPKPFKFHATLNHATTNAHMDSRSPFVPLALRLKKFEAVAENPKPKTTLAVLRQSNSLTKPKSPLLLTKFRNKPASTMISSEEKEALEVKRHPAFKAKTINKKILEGAPIGIPIVEKPALTVPMSPNIHKTFSHPTAAEDIAPRIIKANPIRYTSQPFQPIIEHRLVIPGEFRLPGDEISEKKKKHLELTLMQKQQEEEEIRRFKAMPLPKFEGQSIPKYEPKPPTEPRPFELETSRRSALADKTAVEAYNSNFVARPMPSLEPFIPKKSAKQPTEPDLVILHSDIRAEERRAFDESRKRKDEMIEEMKLMSSKQAEEAEKEEIRRLRQQQTHQAQPIRHYPSVVIRPSDRKLTEPESPMFKEKRQKLKNRANHLKQSFAADDSASTTKATIAENDGHIALGGMAG